MNALINRFRPTNTYRGDVSWTQGPWTASATAQYMTGLADQYFSDDHFLVLGATANYDLPLTSHGKGRVYVRVENLTNEAWENRAHPVYGIGTYPQPGRNFMLGYQHDF